MNKKHNSAYFKKDCYFCTQENELDMTTLQLNEALFHELNIIVSDEEMMKEAIKALRLIVLNWGKSLPKIAEKSMERDSLRPSSRCGVWWNLLQKKSIVTTDFYISTVNETRFY